MNDTLVTHRAVSTRKDPCVFTVIKSLLMFPISLDSSIGLTHGKHTKASMYRSYDGVLPRSNVPAHGMRDNH